MDNISFEERLHDERELAVLIRNGSDSSNLSTAFKFITLEIELKGLSSGVGKEFNIGLLGDGEQSNEDWDKENNE